MMLDSLQHSKGVVGDGIIPALWISYNDPTIEYTGWLLYYRHLRNEGRPTIDYGWWGSFLGMHLNTRWSAGVMFDQFETLHNSSTGRSTYYQWLGPYVGFALPEFNGQVRVFGGWDLSKTDGYTDFYKITYSIAFAK